MPRKAIPKTTVDTAWFQKRLRDLNKTQADLGRYMDWWSSVTARTLAGTRRMTLQEAGKVALFLNVTVSEVLKHAGIDSMPSESLGLSYPVTLTVGPDDKVREKIGGMKATVSFDLRSDKKNIQALCVKGSSLAVEDLHFFFEPQKGVNDTAIGRLCLVSYADNADDELAFVIKAAGRSGYVIRPYSLATGAGEEVSRKLASASPVLWIAC